MGTFRKKYNSNKRSRKGGSDTITSTVSTLPNSSSAKYLVDSTAYTTETPNDLKTDYASSDQNKSSTDSIPDISFLDILKKNKVNLFDESTPETRLDDLGISVKPLSKEAQELYNSSALFPLTVFYYKNDEESRNNLGLNFSEMKNVTVNQLLTTSNIFQCTDIPVENPNYTKENIEQQDGKPIVIGSNIFGETPESVNLDNTNSLFNNVVYQASKKDTNLQKEFVRQARIKAFAPGQIGGVNLDPIRRMQNTTSITADKLSGLYWFLTHSFNNEIRKTEQFINYYMFSQNYKFDSTGLNPSIRQTTTQVQANTSSNISVISDYRQTIVSLTTPTELYSPMPAWIKARGAYMGFVFSAVSYVSFGWLGRDVATGVGAVEPREITYGDLNSTVPGAIGQRTYIVSPIDKKHLLFSIFLKLLVEINDTDFIGLCQLLGVNDTENLSRNKTEIRGFDNIPYHCFMENLYLDISKNSVQIQTVINESSIGNTGLPTDCRDWNNLLSRLYYYFINGNIDGYKVQATYYQYNSQFTATADRVPEVCGSIMGDNYTSGNIMKYSYIDINPPVTFTPQSYRLDGIQKEASRLSGYGAITDGKNKKWFYNTENGNVENENGQTIATPDDPELWRNIGGTGTLISTVNSRITDTRSNLLCYLSELIYLPNDIVKNVSDAMFRARDTPNPNSSKIIYIGGFDTDPSYPYAFDANDSNRLKPSYSRIHVWLYINNNFELGRTALDNIPPLELFIVNRGSKTGLDWEDIDKCISEGTALYNERPLSYSKVLYEILNNLDAKYAEEIRPHMKPSEQRRETLFYNRKIQIISSGHSLGGFLGLYFSFMSLSRNVIENFTSTNRFVGGIRRDNSTNPSTFQVYKYILPIVFQPYVKTTTIMETYNKIPCGIINTVHNVHTISTPLLYVDAASNDFFTYIEGHRGRLKVCKYENVYLNNKITSMNNGLYSKINTPGWAHDIAVNAHALWQMSGLCLKYYAEHIRTGLYVKANISGVEKNQNLEVTKYMFNFNNDCTIYNTDNDGGQPFGVDRALGNIQGNVQKFLNRPNGPLVRAEVGGKLSSKNNTKRKHKRKSNRKTRKMRKNKKY